MLKNKGENVLEKFYAALKEVLNMRISDFLKEFPDVLPRFEYVLENENIENVLKYLKDGIHYLIVVDKKKKMRGIITYIDFMIMFGKKRTSALFAPFSSATRALRKTHVPFKTLSEMKASDIMFIAPPCVSETSKVENALNNMSKTGNNFTVVVKDRNEISGIITAHSIFRAIMRKATFYE